MANPETRLKKLKRLCKKCREFAPAYLAVADLSLEIDKKPDDDWYADALKYTRCAVEADTGYAEAHKRYAALCEQLGFYELAESQYRWLSRNQVNPDVGPEVAADAVAHALTCDFMSQLTTRPEKVRDCKIEDFYSNVLDSDIMFVAFCGWTALDSLLAVIVSAAGITELTPDYHHLRVATELVHDWAIDPFHVEADRRADTLVAMLSCLSEFIRQNGLAERVNELWSQLHGTEIDSWPAPGFAGRYHVEFQNIPPDPGRSYTLADSVTFQEERTMPDLAGHWNCTRTVLRQYEDTLSTFNFVAEFKQHKDTLYILFPKVDGIDLPRSRLTFHYANGQFTLVLWELLAHIPNWEYNQRGYLLLARGGDRMWGSLVKTEADNLGLWLFWSSRGGYYEFTRL